MSKPSKSQLLYEANMKLQKAYAEITRLEQQLADMTSDYFRVHKAFMELKYPTH